MLTALSIANIVLIERLDLDFEAGLGVLTGETGAGKSILLDALGLALGARADSALVRQGSDKAQVTASFTPPAADTPLAVLLADNEIAPEAGEPLLIRRSLKADGGSRAFLNDQPCSAASSAISLSASSAASGVSAVGGAKLAVTCALSLPCRTSALSARAPSASPSASSRIDLPAPVSPVSTPSPASKSRSSRSIRTILAMDKAVSTGRPYRRTKAESIPAAIKRSGRASASACTRAGTIHCPDSWRRAPPPTSSPRPGCRARDSIR